MSTRSFTDTEKREWLMLFDHYDWSAAAFCREYMLPYGSFLNWRRERESLSVPADIGGGDAETRFVELVPQSAQTQCRGQIKGRGLKYRRMSKPLPVLRNKSRDVDKEKIKGR